MPQINKWTEISDDFTDTLLLGNGASMAIDPCFSYRSLRDAAASEGLITESISKVFDHLGTEDFELVMSMIWHAYHVNMALGVPDRVTAQAYDDVKAALVGAVRQKHAGYDAVCSHLRPVYSFMSRFDDVLSLNYDLIVYWAMMEGNLEMGNWFKDCFLSGEFEDNWQRLREPYGAKGTTLVFYPHGNLALTASLLGNEQKISRNSSNASLLSRILDAWQSGEQFPLFVSEGETKQKELAILRSPYLSTVYNAVMPMLGPTYAVYGWSVSENDTHILKRICHKNARAIAFSVYNGGRRQSKIDLECDEIALRVRRVNPDIEVAFYWADSADCWLNTEC